MVLSNLQGRPSAREKGREAAEEGLKGLTGWPRAKERVGVKISFLPCISISYTLGNGSLVRFLFYSFYLLLHSILSTFSFGGGGGGRVGGFILKREVGILYSEYYSFL